MNDLLKKLNYQGHDRILLLNAPDEFYRMLSEISLETNVDRTENVTRKYGFILIFVKSYNEIYRISTKLEEFKGDNALLWFAYPKKSSKKYKSDISRDEGWQPLGTLGYEPVRQVAIDGDWSALRFRKVGEIKRMDRNPQMTISKEGKLKTKGNTKGK